MGWWLILAGVNGLLAVVAGAYGYHGLAVSDDLYRNAFNVGVQYHMWHALALLAVAWLTERDPRDWTPLVAGILFQAGIVLFSGILYALGMTEEVLVQGAAPLGGFLLIGGWLALVWAGVQELRR